MAAEPMGALAPQTLPWPSPGRRGVGAGFPSAAPAPLISGSENRCFFRPQSCGPGPENNQEGRICLFLVCKLGLLTVLMPRFLFPRIKRMVMYKGACCRLMALNAFSDLILSGCKVLVFLFYW